MKLKVSLVWRVVGKIYGKMNVDGHWIVLGEVDSFVLAPVELTARRLASEYIQDQYLGRSKYYRVELEYRSVTREKRSALFEG